ncbi:DUF4917 family protein [Kribbella monticola]|uniref:DUF4917 family protein n=1 Tax=Kribbella monticola TaxID=2185285 RepID=UPI001300639B|nr:DUF4917 family protein [Kribbella monticola]
MTELPTFASIMAWLAATPTSTGRPARLHLVLGNGFSIAYSAATFSYTGLLKQAEESGLIGSMARSFFQQLGTQDFELVVKKLQDAADALEFMDAAGFAGPIEILRREAKDLKEALARILASVHPERPGDIPDDAYLRVRQLIQPFTYVYTTNYDLLLYWALMKSFPQESMVSRMSDDGFRDPGYEGAPHVTWDYLKPQKQNIYYLHGALHLFRAEAELRKLTWVRTDEPLIDQIRAELDAGYFPMYVSEGDSDAKLATIQTSDYLSKGLRSLAEIGGGLAVYGLSFGANDRHLMKAIVRSNVRRMAVGLYGDPASPDNIATRHAVDQLQADRLAHDDRKPLEIEFFDSASVPLWQ